jgi:hypothetical protein
MSTVHRAWKTFTYSLSASRPSNCQLTPISLGFTLILRSAGLSYALARKKPEAGHSNARSRFWRCTPRKFSSAPTITRATAATPLIASFDVLVDKIAGRWFMETILIRLRNDDWLLCSWTLFAGTI